MSILKEIQKRRQLAEISNELLKNYGRKAMKSAENLHHESDREKDPGSKIKLSAKAEVRKNYVRKAAAKVNPGAARDNKNFEGYAKHNHNVTNTKYLEKHYKRRAGLGEEVEPRTLAQIIEEAKKRGRPKKERHEDGETLDEPGVEKN